MAQKEKAVAIRRRIFTGTNQFANPSEKALGRIDPVRLDWLNVAARKVTNHFVCARSAMRRSPAKHRAFCSPNWGREDALCALQLRRQFLCLRRIRYRRRNDLQNAE